MNGGFIASAATLQPDGKILVAGGSGSHIIGVGWRLDTRSFALARYQTDGSLDPSFAEDGVVTTTVIGAGWGRVLALQPDGKIVVAGGGDYGFFPMVRYRGGNQADFYLPIIRKGKNG